MRNTKGKTAIKENFFVYTSGIYSQIKNSGNDLIDNKIGFVYLIVGIITLIIVVVYILKIKFPHLCKRKKQNLEGDLSSVIDYDDN